MNTEANTPQGLTRNAQGQLVNAKGIVVPNDAHDRDLYKGDPSYKPQFNYSVNEDGSHVNAQGQKINGNGELVGSDGQVIQPGASPAFPNGSYNPNAPQPQTIPAQGERMDANGNRL